MTKYLLNSFLFILLTGLINAQSNTALKKSADADSTKLVKDTLIKERDLVDVLRNLTNEKNHPHFFKPKQKTAAVHWAVIPAAGYSLQTGFAALLAANAVFYRNERDSARASSILTSLAYTQYDQIIFPVYINIWTKDEAYNIISDIRYMNYPSQTFGLGLKSALANGYTIDYSYLKIHPAILRNLSHNFFAGVGYYYDYFWNEREINPPPDIKTSFQKYGLYTSETASGICLQGLFDNRINPINPTGGLYASLRYRSNFEWMGSSSNWQSAVLEARKYFRFPQKTQNTLALWSYNWVTLSGKPPYLLLPSTGWDDFSNTGRGYIQGRYRARNMSYLETEYRFRITKNGLLGGVCFANLQTFSRDLSSQYQTVIPGCGLGIRVKMNKHSNTNLCVDYGFGSDGSRGFFVNLGEVF